MEGDDLVPTGCGGSAAAIGGRRGAGGSPGKLGFVV